MSFVSFMSTRTIVRAASCAPSSGRAIKPRAYRPVSHARGWVVRMRELDVSCESTRLTAEGIRNNT